MRESNGKGSDGDCRRESGAETGAPPGYGQPSTGHTHGEVCQTAHANLLMREWVAKQCRHSGEIRNPENARHRELNQRGTPLDSCFRRNDGNWRGMFTN